MEQARRSLGLRHVHKGSLRPPRSGSSSICYIRTLSLTPIHESLKQNQVFITHGVSSEQQDTEMGLGWTQGGLSAPVAIPMYLLLHVQFPPYYFISVHTTEEIQYKSCFNYSKQAAAQPWWFLFSITGKEKLADVWKGDNLFCSISECSSLFSKIYDSSLHFVC